MPEKIVDVVSFTGTFRKFGQFGALFDPISNIKDKDF